MASSARIDDLRKKFEENPRRYFAPLANEYRKAGEIEQAIAICREYLPQQPGHMSGHIVFGQALYEARLFDESKVVFETALTLDPENLIALRHLGDIALLVGDHDAARGWYKRVLDADPRNEEIQSQLALLDSSSAPAAKTAETAPGPAGKTPLSTTVVEQHAVPRPGTATPLSQTVVEQPAIPRPSPNAQIVVLAAVQRPGPKSVEPAEHPSETVTPESPTKELDVADIGAARAAAPTSAPQPPAANELGLEPTSLVESAPAQPPSSEHGMVVESHMTTGSEAPPLDSFNLDGLETTSLAAPPSPPAAPPPAPEPVATAPTPAPGLPDLDFGDATSASEPVAAPVPPPPSVELDFGAVASPAAAATESAPMPASAAPAPAPEIDLDFAPPPATSAAAAEPAAAPVPTPEPIDLDFAPPEPPTPPPAPPGSVEVPSLEMDVAVPEQVTPTPAPVTPAAGEPFMTETMADLYLRQGHVDKALEVYRAVLAQRPNDAGLRARVASLEGSAHAGPGSGPSIRELLGSIAVRRPGYRAPRAGAAAGIAHESEAPQTSATADDALAALMAGAQPSPSDESAAMALARAFASNGDGSQAAAMTGQPAHAASGELSLDTVFGAAGGESPAGGDFALNQYFSQRAHGQAGGGAAEAGAPRDESPEEVAKFTQWLEGLKRR